MLEIFEQVAVMVWESSTWFIQMLDAMGFKGIYLGYVFVAMSTGFLLKRFGSGLSLGSDEAAPMIKSMTYRGKYREGAKRSPVGNRGRYERK